jgi:ribosomal protein S18 acetylase RimI-like enzyme
MRKAATKPAVSIAPADGAGDFDIVNVLFLEYGKSLDFELCFQDFDTELSTLPGAYAPPLGGLLLARVDGAPSGVVAFRTLDDRICEMKRLYVRPEFRGLALGRKLAEAVLQEARQAGYGAMRLDTIGDTMKAAQALYVALGFHQIPRYYDNPIPGALYYEIDLAGQP